MQVPNVYHALEYGNDFPALDFKFENPSDTPELITRIIANVLYAKPDISPSLEYSLECQDGSLMLFIYNHGWGDAKKFTAEVDLSCFGTSLGGKTKALLSQENIEGGLMKDGYLLPAKLELINKNEVREALLPQNFKAPDEWKRHDKNGLSYWEMGTMFFRDSSIPPLPANVTFEDEEGNKYSEVPQLAREQHGAYDWRSIYFSAEEGFVYVHYDGGVRYSLIFPSCVYQFLLEPDQSPSHYEISVAHDIPAKGFERIWLVVGAKKSGFFEVNFTFLTNRGREVVSPNINLHIWNPRNAYFHHQRKSRLGDDSIDIDSQQNNISSPLEDKYLASGVKHYDIRRLKDKKNKSWGY
jgi:hypothetical protein